MRIHDDGTMDNLGRVQDDVHPRLAALTTLRARMLLRERFGDVDAARQVLAALEDVLDVLDQPEPAHDDTPRQKATRSPRPTGQEENT